MPEDLPYSPKMLELAEKWRNGSILPEEKQAFIDWYNQFNDNELVLGPGYEPLINQLRAEMLVAIRQRISADSAADSTADSTRTTAAATTETIPFYKMGWFRLSAAAALIMVVATTTWFLAFRKEKTTAPLAAQKTVPSARGDVMPGRNKAILTLGDGSTIELDSARTGNIIRDGNAQIQKMKDGQLKYMPAESGAASAIKYNVLSTPRGGEYKLVLPDGSQVWLNAASAIRYPTAFTGNERKVEVSGEAYFEVTKNAAMPFKVLVKQKDLMHSAQAKTMDPMEIEVLGTSFNVNAYEDEAAINTTLLQGSVKLTQGKVSGMLKPGQQAQRREDGSIRWIPNADTANAVAWKNGVFEFGDESLQTVMRQIARWYDVEVVYEGNMPADRFTGRVSRNTSLAGVLKILKLSDIRLTIENKKIIVRS
ncbi:MAG TPA: FecR domain-containing protein [Puia sp.]|nr:FecR domain-containing protein [Puia sp.]